jgi:hypothetical protein
VEFEQPAVKPANQANYSATPEIAEAMTPKISQRGYELALVHFNHVEQQVALATTTAGLIVAADALLLGAYVSVSKDYKTFSTLGATFPGIVFMLAGALIVAGLSCALVAVHPNIKLFGKGKIECTVFWMGGWSNFRSL